MSPTFGLAGKAMGVDDFYVCPLARWRQTAVGKSGGSSSRTERFVIPGPAVQVTVHLTAYIDRSLVIKTVVVLIAVERETMRYNAVDSALQGSEI